MRRLSQMQNVDRVCNWYCENVVEQFEPSIFEI